MCKENILIVEDNRIVAEDIKLSLNKMGYDVCAIIPSGEEVAATAAEMRPGLVMMDIMLKGKMNGIEAAGVLKDQLNLPIVYLTAYADEDILQRAMKTEPYGYIVKPFAEKELKVAVEIALYKHRMDRKLIESREWFATTLKSVGDGVIATDPQGIVSFLNPTAERLTGWQQDEAVGKPLSEIFHIVNEYSREPCDNPVQRVLREGAVVGLANHTILISRTGKKIPIADSGAPIRDAAQAIMGVVLVFRDQTLEREAQEALRMEKEKFRLLVEESPFGLSILGKEGAYKYINPRFSELFGYTLEEVPTGREWFRKAFPDEGYRKQVIASWVSCHADSETDKMVPQTFTVTCKDGSQKIIKFFSVRTGTKEQFVIYEDLTEQKKIEEQFFQSQKMEAVGRFAGGVAHDLNNLMSVVIGFSELILEKLGRDDPVREKLDDIYKAGQRATVLTRQLLAFSRKQVMRPKVLDLNHVLLDFEKMLRRLIGEDIELRTALNPNLGRVKADPGQIEQVVMNLAVNARDAMPQGGKLTIETQNVFLDETYAYQHGIELQAGFYVMLAVSDTGVGMDKEITAKIFEPFYTTKEKGKGTGLGLATVYGIVKQSDGCIWVYSEPGQGATFKIYLPRIEQDAELLQQKPIEERPASGSETILIVEDDDAVRKLARTALKSYGYTVLDTRSGEEALAVSRRYSGNIHLLLTDVVMPKISGRQLAEQITKERSKLRVLYMSGYTDNIIAHHGILDQGVNFIQKPLTPKSLALTVREVLDL
jgi:two-component system cell cycle sensor histidine kinase/response regulator CckA